MKQHKILWCMILLFFVIIMPFLLVGYPWFLDGEDMGYMFIASQIKNFWDSFSYGQLMCVAPLEYTSTSFYVDCQQAATFFSTYFRPIISACTYVQYQLFGLVAFPYYAVTIVLHGLIASILFYGLAPLVGCVISWLVCCFFAFHPTLMGWIGKFDTQSAQVSTILALLACIFLVKGITRKRNVYLVFSGFMFFVCLLSREVFILFPVIVFLGLHLLPLGHMYRSIKQRFIYHIQILGWFAVAGIAYLVLRVCCFPLVSLSSTAIFKIPAVKFSTIFHFFYDIFWLQLIPWSSYAFFSSYAHGWYYGVYVALKILILLIMGILFVTNTRKKWILFACLAAITFYWQFFFGVGLSIKQLYESLPFVMFGLTVLLGYSRIIQKRLVRVLVLSFLSMGVVINAYNVLSHVRWLRNYGIKKSNATDYLKDMVGNTLINKPLCYMGNTSVLSSVGILQAAWLKGVSHQVPHYFLTKLLIASHVSYATAIKHVKMEKIDDGFRVTSLDHDNVWFMFSPGLMPDYLKEFIIHEQQDDKIFDASIMFKQASWNPAMVMLLYFFEDECFLVFDR